MANEDQGTASWRQFEKSTSQARLAERVGRDGNRRWTWAVVAGDSPSTFPPQVDDEAYEDDEYSPACCPFCGLGAGSFCQHQVGQWGDGINASGIDVGTYELTDPYFKVQEAIERDGRDLDEIEDSLGAASFDGDAGFLIESMLHEDEAEERYLQLLASLGVEEESQAWEGTCISGTQMIYFHADPPVLYAKLASIEKAALDWLQEQQLRPVHDESQTDGGEGE
jgi:hypothetical protein